MFTANNNVILCHFIRKLSKSHIVVIVVIGLRTEYRVKTVYVCIELISKTCSSVTIIMIIIIVMNDMKYPYVFIRCVCQHKRENYLLFAANERFACIANEFICQANHI